jgi:hypothetical protein
MESFKAVEDKSAFLEPTVQFLKEEEEDQIRAWGTSVLELIGGERAFSFLVEMLGTEKTMRKYLYTRFFALKACANLAKSDQEQSELLTLLKHMWQDEDEDYLSQAEASILLARHERSEVHLRRDAEVKVKDMLSEERFGEYWPALRALRALREFPLPDLADDIILIIRMHPYLEHRAQAIQALGAYTDNLAVVRELGLIVRTSPDSDLRLKAVRSLARLRHPESQEDLVQALDDENGEVRIQASEALKSLLKGDAVAAIAQHALREGIGEESLAHLVDALRRIDRDRSTEELSKELSGEDRRRAQVAERILLELGGWAAVQRLGTRRNTLEALDRLLAQSEEAMRDTFQDTIRQARRNFYFAMGVNVLVVLVGLSLIVLAMMQLMQKPEKLEDWIVPGAGGVFGVIINMAFNNPRRNAREDLSSLMNVNVIFYGFLSRLKEIDATFKHVYMESVSFGTEEMDKTVEQIHRAVTEALDMSAQHLGIQQSGALQHLRNSSSRNA